MKREDYFEDNKKNEFACQQMLVIIGNVNFGKIKKTLQAQIKDKLTKLKADPKVERVSKRRWRYFCARQIYM